MREFLPKALLVIGAFLFVMAVTMLIGYGGFGTCGWGNC